MANATPSRLGQINGANDVDALFLKVFSGEILTTFEEFNVATYTAPVSRTVIAKNSPSAAMLH